jgi:hypothetical protein
MLNERSVQSFEMVVLVIRHIEYRRQGKVYKPDDSQVINGLLEGKWPVTC